MSSRLVAFGLSLTAAALAGSSCDMPDGTPPLTGNHGQGHALPGSPGGPGNVRGNVCTPDGDGCGLDEECCSAVCTDGECGSPVNYCLEDGAVCTMDGQCCTG